MNEITTHILELNDHPESKIRFIEQVMGDREWDVLLHFPTFDTKSAANISTVIGNLKRRGYEVVSTRDDHGHQCLLIHHFSSSPNAAELLRRYGLLKGTGHIIENPIGSMKSLLYGVYDGIGQSIEYLKDPAHANGTIFMTAEAFLMMAGQGNSHGNIFHLKNALQSLAGTLWGAQSLAYMTLAEKGDDRIAKSLAKTLTPEVIEQHQFKLLQPVTDSQPAPSNSALSQPVQWAKNNPIELGAWLNISGMVAFMAHAVLEKKHHLDVLLKEPANAASLRYVEKGFRRDIGGALTSLVAWGCLLLPSREEPSESKSGERTMWDRIADNPEKLSSLIMTGASAQRLLGAIHKGNKYQQIGEAIYLPGDLLLAFVKNQTYGKSQADKTDELIDKTAEIISALPLIASPDRLDDFIRQTAAFIAREHCRLSSDGKPVDDATVEARTTTIEKGLHAKTDETFRRRFERFTAITKRLIEESGHANDAQWIDRFINLLDGLHGINISSQTMEVALCSLNKAAKSVHSEPEKLIPLIREMVAIAPHPYAGDNIAKLYDLLVENRILTEDTPTTTISERQSKRVAEVTAHRG